LKKQKKLMIMAVALVFITGGGLFLAFWGGIFAPKTQVFIPHYLAYYDAESKIFVVSETKNFGYADQTYITADGQTVEAGSGIFTIRLTLRNDYTSDNPPPYKETPVSPIDGTAYIWLKAKLFSYDMAIPTVNVSESDFPTSADQTGLVLASGQTINALLLLATNQTVITESFVSLEYLGDSIPR
jgi:hypothetical protein